MAAEEKAEEEEEEESSDEDSDDDDEPKVKADLPERVAAKAAAAAAAAAKAAHANFAVPRAVDLDVQMKSLSARIYAHGSERAKTRTLLCHVYHHALHGRYTSARDMLLMSHLGESIHQCDISTQAWITSSHHHDYTRRVHMTHRMTSCPHHEHISSAPPRTSYTTARSSLIDSFLHPDASAQILYNRAMVRLGICAFANELILEAHSALMELASGARLKELLAQVRDKSPR